MNEFIKLVTGTLLIIIPVLLVIQGQLRYADRRTHTTEHRFRWSVVAIGLLAGVLVGMSSIGSGSVTMLLLMMIYPYAPAIIVGSDIVHAVALTSFTSALHISLGTVNVPLVSALLIGSIPGALLGTRLSSYVPAHWLKRILCGVLFLTGARLLI